MKTPSVDVVNRTCIFLIDRVDHKSIVSITNLSSTNGVARPTCGLFLAKQS
jgi:hypothetical protein